MKPIFSLMTAKRGRLTIRLSIALTLLVAGTPMLLSGGCGGGGNNPMQSAATRKTGGLSLSVTWPDRTRLIPDAAESIVVTVRRAGAVLRTTTLQRPAAGQPLTTVASFDSLPVGNDYAISAQAFPVNNGTGVAQAQSAAAIPFTVTDNVRTPIAVTMDSTIATLTLEPVVTFPLGAGRFRTLTAVARDASGAVVLLSPRRVTFQLAETVPGTATLTPLDATPESDVDVSIINAPTTGSVTLTITATDTESGRVATLDIPVSPTGIAEDASWAKFHGDLHNTGRLAQTLSAPAGDVSTFLPGTSSIVFASPVVDKDGTVYIGAYDGRVRAIRNGAVIWEVQTGAEVESTPVLSRDGSLYVGSNDGRLYCIETRALPNEDNRVRFAYEADGPIYGSPTLSAEGVVYFGTTTGTMYALDGLTGPGANNEPIWSRTFTAEGIQTTPALVGSGDSAILYFGAGDGNVYAVSVLDGTDVHTPFNTGTTIFSSSCAVDDNGNIYFGTLNGNLYSLTADLTQRWVFDAGAPIYGTPAISTDNFTVYVGTLDNFSGLNESKFFAVDAGSGNQNFEFLAGDGITASPAIGSDGTIYFTSLDRNLYALDSNDFSVKFQARVGGAPVPDEPLVYIESSPGFGPDGAIYFGTTDDSGNGTVQVVR